MEVKGNKYIFENDEELTNFCISNEPVVKYCDKINRFYYDYEMTPEYDKAINDGNIFIVRDPNSIAVKNGHIHRGLITIKVCCYGEYDECNDYSDI